MDLTPEEILALLKSIPTKEAASARKQIDNESEADVNLLVQVSGRLVRGAKPKPAKGTSRIPWKVAVALFVKRAGFTGPTTVKLLADAITDAINMGRDAEADLIVASGVGDALALVERDLFSKLPPIEKEGTIKFVPHSDGGIKAIRQPMLTVDNALESEEGDEDAAK